MSSRPVLVPGNVVTQPPTVTITRVQPAPAATGSSAAPAVTFGSTPTAGNLLVAAVAANFNGTISMTSAGWTALTNATGSNANRSIRLFYKIAGVSEPATVTAAITSSAWDMHASEYSFTGSIFAPTENAQVNGSSSTQVTPSITPQSGRAALVVACVLVGANQTWGSQQINAVGATVESSGSRAVASSTLFDVIVANTAGSYQGSAVATGGATGAGAIAAFTSI